MSQRQDLHLCVDAHWKNAVFNFERYNKSQNGGNLGGRVVSCWCVTHAWVHTVSTGREDPRRFQEGIKRADVTPGCKTALQEQAPPLCVCTDKCVCISPSGCTNSSLLSRVRASELNPKKWHQYMYRKSNFRICFSSWDKLPPDGFQWLWNLHAFIFTFCVPLKLSIRFWCLKIFQVPAPAKRSGFCGVLFTDDQKRWPSLWILEKCWLTEEKLSNPSNVRIDVRCFLQMFPIRFCGSALHIVV